MGNRPSPSIFVHFRLVLSKRAKCDGQTALHSPDSLRIQVNYQGHHPKTIKYTKIKGTKGN